MTRKHSGQFCKNSKKLWKKNLGNSTKQRWVNYRNSESLGNVIHDHNYEQSENSQSTQSVSNASYEGLDIQEEVISESLPRYVVPIDRFRLVVELGIIVKQLKDGCSQCHLQLNLCNAKGVFPRGLGGWLYIYCENPACMKMNRISIGKQHRTKRQENKKPRGYATFDINTKAASGMIHAGIGERHLNNLFTMMNLPEISQQILKDRENEIGSLLETFAQTSAKSALMLEKEMSGKELHGDGIEGDVGIEVSSDTAWQKRGSQRSYNSLSGFSSTIGKRTKKVVHFNARYKRCRICWRAKVSNKPPRKHTCMVNWYGSAKAMEPDMFAEMIKDSTEKNVKVAKVAGDDDHTGINRVRQEGNIEIIKESDKNHVRKNVTKRLYPLAKQHKSLTQKVISSVTKNFNYMLEQNKGKPEGVAKGLKAVVEHMFGNHEFCQDWCGFLRDPEKYRHGNLPHGKDLTDKLLHTALTEIFSSLNCDKLAHLSSTQANESLNNTVSSKAPKARHYSDSPSLQYRICAGVSQKNEGYTYMTQVHKAAGLSPGVSAKKRGQ